MITVTIKIKGDRNKVVAVTGEVKRGKRVTREEELAEKIIQEFYLAANRAIGVACGNRIHIPAGAPDAAECEKQFRKIVSDLSRGKKTG